MKKTDLLETSREGSSNEQKEEEKKLIKPTRTKSKIHHPFRFCHWNGFGIEKNLIILFWHDTLLWNKYAKQKMKKYSKMVLLRHYFYCVTSHSKNQFFPLIFFLHFEDKRNLKKNQLLKRVQFVCTTANFFFTNSF